jgi:outer membrane protease
MVSLPGLEALDIHYWVKPQLGILYGQAEEIVYRDSSKAYLSQLLWDIKPLFYGGVNGGLSAGDFWADLDFKAALPSRSGYMEDRDWMGGASYGFSNYSISNNYTKNTFLADIRAGWNFDFFIAEDQTLSLKPFLRGSWMHFSWDGKGGYYQYGYPWSESIPKKYWTDDTVTIAYKQDWMILSPGLEANYAFLEKFVAGLSFCITPFIMMNAVDNHMLRGGEYYGNGDRRNDPNKFSDYAHWGLLLEGGASFAYQFNSNISAELSGSFRHIKGSRGKSTSEYTNTPGAPVVNNGDTGGAGYWAWDAGLGIRIRLH